MLLPGRPLADLFLPPLIARRRWGSEHNPGAALGPHAKVAPHPAPTHGLLGAKLGHGVETRLAAGPAVLGVFPIRIVFDVRRQALVAAVGARDDRVMSVIPHRLVPFPQHVWVAAVDQLGLSGPPVGSAPGGVDEGSTVAWQIRVCVGRYGGSWCDRLPQVGLHVDAVGGFRAAVLPVLVVDSVYVVLRTPGVLRANVVRIIAESGIGPIFGLVFFRGAGVKIEGFIAFVFVMLVHFDVGGSGEEKADGGGEAIINAFKGVVLWNGRGLRSASRLGFDGC